MKTVSHVISLILAATGALLAVADQITPLAQINPQFAHWWPVVLAAATVSDRFFKLILANVNGEQAAKVLIAAAAVSLVLTGCAGSAVDRDFRSKVDSVSVHGGGAYDPATGIVGGSVDTTLHFRDPRTEGLAK